MFNKHIFREYDIRGVFEKDFDLDFCFELGQRFSFYLSKKLRKPSSNLVVNIGRDARLSSTPIQDHLMRGIASTGASVRDLGLVTTPLSYFSYFHWETDGSIMVTGSHNPPEYNGFKISKEKSSMFGSEIQELGELFSEKSFGEKSSTPGKIEAVDIKTPYVSRYREEFQGLINKNIKVVLDCGNGAAGSIARRLFEACGLTPTILFEEPDGTFPNHHPDPTLPENIKDLQNAVVSEQAHFGVGLDGDADRIVLVDEKGQARLGDELMVLVSRHILKNQKGAKIVGDVKCSDLLYKDVESSGGQPIMWKTGHSLIKNKIKEEKAPFGGELSGHIFFADRNYGYDDALYAGLRIAEILSQDGGTISEKLSDLPKTFNTPEIRIDTTEEKKSLMVEKLIQHFKGHDSYKLNLIDGLRISFPSGWALARASNTQPVLVLRFESTNKADLESVQKEFYSIIEPILKN